MQRRTRCDRSAAADATAGGSACGDGPVTTGPLRRTLQGLVSSMQTDPMRPVRSPGRSRSLFRPCLRTRHDRSASLDAIAARSVYQKGYSPLIYPCWEECFPVDAGWPQVDR